MSATAGTEIFGAFSNDAAYNVSFSTNAGGQVVASANVTASPSPVNVTGENGSSVNAQTIQFGNANGMSLGVSTAANGATVTGSYTVPAQTAYVFSNSNGVSFGTNGSTVTATVATNYQSQGAYLTTARASNDAVGLNTAVSNVTATINSSGFSFDARGYAGTGTSATNATLTLNSAGLQISVAAPPSTAGLISAIGVTGSNGNYTTTGLSFSNGNGVSFGTSAGSAITASHNGLTSQSGQAASGANGSFAFQTLSFSNANGISFGTSAGSAITASHNAITTARASNDGIGLNTAQTNVTWTANSSGLSINAAGYAGTATSITGGAAITLNSAGLAFNGASLAGTTSGFTGANISATITHNTAGLALSMSVAAPGGGATPVASASNGSFSFTTLGFSNANNVTFGTSAGGIITASVAAPGAAAENNWVNLVGANTAGNTTASGSTIGYSGINMTISGTNGSVINFSVAATSSLVGVGGISISTNGSTISISNSAKLNNYENVNKANNSSYSSFGQNTAYLQHFIPENVVQFSYAEIWARGSFASSTNSQVYAQTIRYGIYSQETGASSTRMTLAGSSSNVIQVSFASNTGMGFTVNDGATSYTTTSGGTGLITNISGPFHHYLPFSSTLQPNVKHAFAVLISSATTGGTSPFRYAPFVNTVMNSLSMGRIFNTATVAAGTTVIGDREMGVYSATSGALPSSYATANISAAVSRQILPFMLEV